MNSPHSSPHASSAGKPRWPGCAGWWIRSRRPARSCSSPARRAWARPCCWRTPPNGPGRRACGCCRSPAGNRSRNSRSPGCISSCGRCCPAPPAFPAGRPGRCWGRSAWPRTPVAPDPLLTGVAVLTLLSDLSERSPVLVVADDAHWLDRSSLDALAFAGSRLDAERVVLLVGARGQAPPPGFDRGFPELHLEPLSAADAGRLLDGQPRPPRGRARAQVLAQAAGNPMALIELAKVIADDPAASRRWAAEPLPLTDRLSAVISLPVRRPARAGAGRAAAGRGGRRPGPERGRQPRCRARCAGPRAGRASWAWSRWTGPACSSPIPSSVPPSTTPRPSRSAPRRTASSPRPCTTSQTGGPGTWPPRRCIPTSRWLRCWRPPRPRRSAAAARPPPRWRWNARPNSAPTPQDQARQAGRRRLGRRSHRPGGLGPGSRHPRPGGHGGPGTAADRPPRRRVGAGLLRPAHRRAAGAHLRRRRGIA